MHQPIIPMAVLIASVLAMATTCKEETEDSRRLKQFTSVNENCLLDNFV